MTIGIRDVLTEVFAAEPERVQFVGGGSINQAARITVRGDNYFVKWKNDAPVGFFEAEARGLDVLREAAAIRVPEIIKVEAGDDQRPAYLILEWLEEASDTETLAFSVNFGRALAQLHRHSATTFGLDHDNYIGALPQSNTPTADWVSFYRDQRIAPQVTLARKLGRLPTERERLLRKVMENLDKLLEGAALLPSLLHGDLWSGNFMVLANNLPALIDPAVYYGDREVELAFTELFGGFPASFYPAYREAFPLDRGYERRKALYQLYPLLVHLNLFGESYGMRVDAICRQYVH
ncbi:MAG: fructosamine kinase family protein [Anaerolineae bacterium]|nr:fructosamine kinase family protein [Anaerolineae bacterium]